MTFENLDSEQLANDGGGTPVEEAGNRTFFIAIGVLGAVALLALVIIAVYALVLRPQQLARREQQAATLNIQNTQVAKAITLTSIVIGATYTPTVTPVPPTATASPTPTNTAVVVLATSTSEAMPDSRTATIAALLTQAAITTRTVVPTATALPNTGFADDVGLPSTLGLAAMLIVVIFISRRLRTA